MGSVADVLISATCCLTRWCLRSSQQLASQDSLSSYPPRAVECSGASNVSSKRLECAMNGISREYRTAACAESGFTFAEILMALALVLLLSAGAARTLLEAGRAAIRAKKETEWISTVTLFDRTLRAAFSSWPPAFWGRNPDIERSVTGYRIIDRSEATSYTVEISMDAAGAGTVAIRWGGRNMAIGALASISVEPCNESGTEACAVVVLIASGSHEQQFVVTFGGARL